MNKKVDLHIRLTETEIRFIFFAFLLVIPFLYLVQHLYKLQVRDHSSFSAEKDSQHVFTEGDQSGRGNIFMTRKDGQLLPLAQMVPVFKLTLSPREVPAEYRKRAYELVSGVAKVEEEDFLKKISKPGDPYEEIGVITEEEKNRLEELSIVGVHVYETKERQYPFKEISARTVGFVGGGDDGYVGRYGLEKYYDDVLSAQSVERRSFFSTLFSDLKLKTSRGSVGTRDIVTTLEPNVSVFLYNTLQETKEKWSSDQVSGVIMNIKTGEIIAMDTVPSFDPNKYKESSQKNFTNPIVQGVYELGSIFKPITMSVAIEHGLVNPKSIFHDTGSVKLNGYTIRNFDLKVRGDVTMQQVLNYSMNTGLVYVMQLLGRDLFRDGVHGFLMEEETGIDLPGEVNNKMKNIHSTTEIDYATAAFGQGIALSPISILRGLSSIPNSGKLVTPYVVASNLTADGELEGVRPEDLEKSSVSTTTAETMKNMMINLIDEGLANGKYKDDRFQVGAKTGTAQMPKPGGGYYEDRYLHSYYIFFPGKDPQFALLIFQVNPRGASLSSITLAPPASKIKDFVLSYYSITPDR